MNNIRSADRISATALARTLGIAALIILALSDPMTVTEAARQSCRVWAESVMPALFPFVVLSLMLVSGAQTLGLSDRILTGLSIALGMLGGSPSGAQLILQMHSNGKLTNRTAQCAAACITTASPMFILATLTSWLNTNRYVGLIMLTSHLIASLLAGLICLAWTRHWPHSPSLPYYTTPNLPLNTTKPTTLGEAVTQAAAAMLTVCGCMILFNAAVAVAITRFNLPAHAAAMLAAMLEMAGGCVRIAGQRLPITTAAPLLCATVTLGGASVFMQNASFLSKAGVKLSVQLSARIVAAALAWAMCTTLLRFF